MFQIPLPFAQLVLSAINHITRQQPWLREVMAAHAGQVVRIRALPPGAEPRGQGGSGRRGTAAGAVRGSGHAGGSGHAAGSGHDGAHAGQDPSPFGLPTLQADARIGADGTLSAVSGEEPSVLLTARPTVDALFRVLREGPLALGATLRIEGDVMLAQALGEVARALHWDVEEDLSQVVGDVAAHRAGQFWREARAHAEEASGRLREVLTDHLSSEVGVLVSRAEFEDWSDDLQALEQRLARLEGAAARG